MDTIRRSESTQGSETRPDRDDLIRATIALAGAAVGIGNVLSSLIHSMARNPSLAKQLFAYAILGFALTEAIALFAPMMAFLISSFIRVEEGKTSATPFSDRKG